MTVNKFSINKDDVWDIIYEGFKSYKYMRGLTRSEELLIMDFCDSLGHEWENHFEKIVTTEE